MEETIWLATIFVIMGAESHTPWWVIAVFCVLAVVSCAAHRAANKHRTP